MATNKPTQSVQVGGYSRRLRIMSRIYFPFRFLSRFSLSEDIFLSTLALSTPASFFASSSNARHPLGFFAAMLFTSLSLEFDAVLPAADQIAVWEPAGEPANGIPRPVRNVVDAFNDATMPLYTDEDCRFHLFNPHEARILHAGKFAVCESLPDRSGHRGLESVGVVPLRHQCSP